MEDGKNTGYYACRLQEQLTDESESLIWSFPRIQAPQKTPSAFGSMSNGSGGMGKG